MKLKNKIKFCSKKIYWPKKAYGVMIPIFRESEAYWLYTDYKMLVDLKQVRKIAREFQDELTEYNESGLNSGETVIIFEMKLERQLKMSPDYWIKDGLNYSDTDRNKLLMEAVKTYQFYEILVTATGDQETPYAIAAAFYKHHPEDIETFMQTTNWQVDQNARTSAIYSISKTYGYNWVNDEILSNNDNLATIVN